MPILKKHKLEVSLLAISLCLPFSIQAQQTHEKLSQALQTRLLTTSVNESVTLFIYFKDKGENIEQKLVAAEQALTPAALHRRRVNRGVDNVVSFSDIPVNPDYVKRVKREVLKVRHELKTLNAISVEATPADILKISRLDFVERVEQVNAVERQPEPEIPAQAQALDVNPLDLIQPNNTQALNYGSSFTQNNQINVPAVHDLGYDGTGVVIAVFDSGFNRLTHESFNQMDIAGAWDFVNGDGDVGDGSDQGNGSHGTNTLSTVGGYSPGDLIGPAYGATYYLAKTENSESELHVEEDNWCAAAEWADTNGAHIITSSLGYTSFDVGVDYSPSDMDGDTTVITRCADLVAQNGVVVINSAGNSGSGSGSNTLGAPSDGDFVLAVGAVTSSGSRSSFSSVGPSADGRIKPDVMAMGSSVRVASANSNTGYSSVNGTSFSCPLTAGVAALVLESNPNLTATEVRDILRNTADRASSPNSTFGYGIIDALAAVEAAVGGTAPSASFNVVTDESSNAASFTSTSSDSDGSIVTYAWDFGDGQSSSLQNPSHTYAAEGTYSVTLSVTDNDNLTDSSTQSVTVPFVNLKTVGNTTIFGSNTTTANRRAMPYTMPEDGTITSISMHHQAGSGDMLLAVYGGAGTPNNLLAVTPATPVSASTDWQTIDLVNSVEVSAGQTIWLAWVYESNPGISYQTGSPGRVDAGTTWTSGMPQTFGSSSQANFIYSIYANYIPGNSEPQVCDVNETFESGAGGWTNDPSSTCSTGAFVVGTPTEVVNGGVTTQLAGAHGGSNAFFSAVNTSAGANDVDGGNCIVNSPVYSVTQNSNISIQYYHGQRDTGGDSQDFFRLEMSTDGGLNYSPMASIGDVSTNATWTEATATAQAGTQVQFRVQVSDGASGGDLIEAGIDDVSICAQ
ncbi:PKD domain-containing protein [Alteromonadaceae bacterium M269]|nr:PKD domain-containing protein [Alteromonadaceae bacterium M269]